MKCVGSGNRFGLLCRVGVEAKPVGRAEISTRRMAGEVVS